MDFQKENKTLFITPRGEIGTENTYKAVAM
jgi:hypothetical protein